MSRICNLLLFDARPHPCPWITLKKAAQRLIAHPTPHFLLEASTSIEGRMTLLRADREYLLSSLRFGLDPVKIMARNYWLSTKDPLHRDRYLAHMGYCGDVYDYEANALLPRIRCHYKAIEESKIPGEEPVDEAMYGNPQPLPSLPFEGPQCCPPIAEEQAPFIHSRINRGNKLHLLVISPDTDLTAPLQCGLVDANVDEYPDFSFIWNHGFLRRPLLSENYLLSQFPVTTRTTSIILVNNQAFTVP